MKHFNERNISSLGGKAMALLAIVFVSIFALAKGKTGTETKRNNEHALLKKPSSLPNMTTFDCLTAAAIKSFGCESRGVDQATLTVRSDGTWGFSVHYCCNISPSSCSHEGKGWSTAPGAVKHEEWSMNKQTGCLELRVKQVY